MRLYNIRRNIGKGVYLNLINTNKFKTNLISIYVIRPLLRDEVTKNALIPTVLRRGTRTYNTSLDINRKLEELYGLNLSISVVKKGERQVIRFNIEGPQSNFINTKSLFEEKIKMLKEIITNPYLEKGSFLEEYVEQEKKNLVKRIEGRINDKKQYAVDRCIEEMCKNEDYSLFKYGYVEDLENITKDDIYRHYTNILQTSPIEICIVGSIEEEQALNGIEKFFNLDRQDIIRIEREKVIVDVNNEKEVFDEMDISQGKLTLGYRINIPYEDDLYEPFLIANDILGGGPHSKLFMNVREKESLAYYVYSKTYKFKSIMLIASGIEHENYGKALDIIKRQVDELRKGNFTEEDIEQSKKSIITSIRTMTDSNYALSEFYLSQAITNDNRSIEDVIEKIERVNKDDIIKSTMGLSLDTIYFLSKK